MMKTSFNAYILGIVLAMIACNAEEIDHKNIGLEREKLVVNGLTDNQNDTLFFQLSTSEYAYNDSFPKKIKENDANILFSINGKNQKVEFAPFQEKFYVIDKIKQGDILKIEAEKDGYSKIIASTQVPILPNDWQIEVITGKGLDSRNEPSDIIQISFKDFENQRNYYGLKLFYLEEGTNVLRDVIFEKNDIAFLGSDFLEQNDRTLIFSDQSFEGQNKNLQIVPESGQGNFNQDIKYVLKFYHLHPDYYRYLSSLESYNDDFGDNQLSPFRLTSGLFSNVQNGLGIWTSQNLRIDTLR